MSKSPIELTEAEWTVIKAVWDNEPCDAPAIQQKLFKKTGWTYSTVRTLMDRMAAKKLLAAEKIRNQTLYRSARDAGAGAARRIALRAETRVRRRAHADGAMPHRKPRFEHGGTHPAGILDQGQKEIGEEIIPHRKGNP